MHPSMQETMSAIRKHAPNFVPKVGLILGSGLGSITDAITQPITIPYQAIPGLHSGAVAGHASLMVMGYLQGVPVVCMKGRLHLYEGVSLDCVRTFVRLIKNLGASSLVVTGAAGSLRPEMGAGEVMVMTDHLNFQPNNPLLGPNDESVGPRFVSLENAYDDGLRLQFLNIARRLNITVHEGVYLSLSGPSFETPAEIRAFAMLGADTVGMSVVPEVIIARHCGLKVLGLAAITNLAVGLSAEKVTHDVTLRFAEIAARKLTKLIPDYVKEVGNAD